MKLRLRKNNNIADKNRRNFLENSSRVFPRCTHQGASIELLFVEIGSVGASEKKITQKKRQMKTSL